MASLKILELFGGIGACSKALERLGIEYEIADYVEIDKYAVASFNAMHETNFKPQDICDWDKNIDVDLIMHGSPCQDFSLAGKQAGGDEGSGTRSSLMYETIRIVEKLKPKYVIWENVKNLLSKKHRHNFDKYLETMEQLGYKNYYQVLNAKDYGIPQNRERVFTISIRNDIDKEFIFPEKQELKLKLKDMLEDNVDEKYYLSDKQLESLENGSYNASKPSVKLEITDKGLCQTLDTMSGGNRQPLVRVKEKYYLSNKMIDYITSKDDKYKVNENKLVINRDIAYSKTTREGNTRADTSDYICREMPENTNILKIKNATKQGYLEATDGDSVNLAYPDSKTRRGRVGEQVSQTLQCNDSMGVVIIPQAVKVRKHKVNIEKLKKTLKLNKKYTNKEIASKLNVSVTTVEHWFRDDGSFSVPIADIWFDLKKLLNIETEEFDKSITEFEEKEGVYEKSNRYYLDNGIAPTLTHTNANEKIISDLRIRKLTPKECWRLMGFDDEDFEKASKVNSNSQLYKQAGNSIVVNVLEAILRNLLLNKNIQSGEKQLTIFDLK